MVTFSELKTLEEKTLQAIRTQGDFGHLNSLVTAAKQAQVNGAPKGPLDLHLSFTLPTRLREDGGRQAIHRSFHVGCYAASTPQGDGIAQLSYSVLIGQEADPSKTVARKFHFDFEPSALRNAGESKPTFHLQMCGELSNHHSTYGYTDEHIAHLLPSWSQPRIPAQPMSLALVLNWLFIEFGREAPVKAARVSPRWRSIVRNAERIILKPYYDECSSFFNAAAHEEESFTSKRLYEDH